MITSTIKQWRWRHHYRFWKKSTTLDIFVSKHLQNNNEKKKSVNCLCHKAKFTHFQNVQLSLLLIKRQIYNFTTHNETKFQIWISWSGRLVTKGCNYFTPIFYFTPTFYELWRSKKGQKNLALSHLWKQKMIKKTHCLLH